MVGFHTELKIVRGILNAPGDTGSAETGYTIIDLLSGSAEGFALNSDAGGWDPALPAPKSGLWNDVPFTDGRVPYAGAEGNVTETLSITISASSQLRLSELLSDLYDMIEDTKRFWFDEFNCQPVFLWWWAHDAPGRQFALIMSIDVDVSIPGVADDNNIVRDLTLTIEREPYWMAEVPPGANPIYWTLFAQNKQPGLDYSYEEDLVLLEYSPVPLSFPVRYALASGTIQNGVRYSALPYNSPPSPGVVFLSENRLTIPASSIPGDAPALLQLSLFSAVSGLFEQFGYLIARSTRKRSEVMRVGTEVFYVTSIPFTSGELTGNTVAADTGGIGGFQVNTGATLGDSRLEITPTATMTTEFSAHLPLSTTIQRGRFAVFVRCRQNGGNAGDITLQVRAAYNDFGTGTSEVTAAVSAPLLAGTGNTTEWPLAYCGTLRLPFGRDHVLSDRGQFGGTGIYNEYADNLAIRLEVRRSAGSALLYFVDILLLPYDEALLECLPTARDTNEYFDSLVIDNTRYLSRGKPEQIGYVNRNTTAVSSGQDNIEQTGSALTLEPGVDNHLYFLQINNETGRSSPRNTIHVHANIVPRWRGIRAT
jgi:hypothetical protein